MKRISMWVIIARMFTIMFGLFLCLILLEAGLRVAGSVVLSWQEHMNRISIQQKGTYRIMCVGESTTAVGGEDSYPSQLQKILNQRGSGVKFSVINKGVPGIHTADILDSLERNLDSYHPDMVISMMGASDLESYMPYKVIPDSKALSFLRSFKIYKLGRLLWLHIVTVRSQPLPPEGRPQQPSVESQDEPRSKKLLRLEKAIELSPENDAAYVELGQFYQEQSKFPEAEVLFRQALEVNPKNDRLYVELGRFYRVQGELSEAEVLFNKAIKINPHDDLPYFELGWIFRIQGKFSEAEAAIKKAIELNPVNDKACAALRVLYMEKGDLKLAREYDVKAHQLRSGYYPQFVTRNYHKLKAILDKRGIMYVCMQYPLRGLEPLKKIFQGNSGNIIFVDNQKVFQEAVKRRGYKEYFADMCGGDFGHCTPEGNRLLAENTADVILDKVFSVKKTDKCIEALSGPGQRVREERQ